MKKYKITPIALVLFILCALTTGVYSYMFKRTPEIENQFIPGKVSCEVIEKTDGTATDSLTQKEDITVTNTGNIDAYIRVRFVSYWVNATGGIVAKDSVMPSIPFNGTNWIKGSNDTYYYKTKVTPLSSTVDLLAEGKVIALDEYTFIDDNDNEVTYYQVVDVFAEAIQANPEAAVIDAWKVTITDTEITKVK